jgi:threonine/homoserine/homoserine lactone efflux protein
MSLDLLAAFILFAIVMLFTPGPNNILLMTSGLGTASSAAWAAFGSALRRVLKDPAHARIFNVTMAVLLVASLYPVFADAWR